jgi:hypothetical protein
VSCIRPGLAGVARLTSFPVPTYIQSVFLGVLGVLVVILTLVGMDEVMIA